MLVVVAAVKIGKAFLPASVKTAIGGYLPS